MGSSCCDFPHPNPLYLSSLSPKSAQASEQQWKQLRRDCLSKEISRIGSVLFHFAQAASDGAGLAGVDTRGCDGRRERCRRRHEDARAMEVILDALASYVTKLTTDKAQEEVVMLLGVPGELEKLGRNLRNIKAFLADAERRRIKEELVQGWVSMLKGVMYDATDVLELGQLKAEERRESKLGRSIEKMPGCCQPFLFCLRNPVFAHKIGSRIKELNQRLEDIHTKAAEFNFLTANLGPYQEQRTEAAEYFSRQRMTSEFIQSSIVGEKIEMDTRLLVHELTIPTDQNHDIMKVVSIVGMGGMGKTTLAQKILKDVTIDEHFKTKIWLSITQQFNEVELLRSAIKLAGGNHGGEENNNFLTQTLTNALSASKFLLVLDDMWSIRAWESVLSVPVTNASDKQPGSRVLITTRFEDLAPRMHHFFFQHHVSPLDEEEAWSLLKNQFPQLPNQGSRAPVPRAQCSSCSIAAGSRSSVSRSISQTAPTDSAALVPRPCPLTAARDATCSPARAPTPPSAPKLRRRWAPVKQVSRVDHLKDVGMKIIKKCGGLPLAIKILGGLLLTEPRTVLAWETILNHHAWSLDGLPDELDHRLYLSYEYLSPQLKQCFLYCSLFPKGNFIIRGFVTSMWISEGFVQTGDGTKQSPEEVANKYYHELIMRNLIESTDSLTQQKCTMHDVVRSFAEFIAREESVVLRDEKVPSCGSVGLVRRLSVGSTKSVLEWANFQKQQSLRTLLINCKINVKLGDSLTSFPSLRVLYIEHADCDTLVDSLCQLRHLRYLGFRETNISKLPEDLHRLKFLQHLMLNDCTSVEKLPSSIIKLAHLRKLNVRGSCDVLIPRGFGELTNLRSLLGFPVHVETNGGWCSLEEIGPLSQLGGLSLHGLENASTSSSWAEKAMISSKENLSYLELNWSSSRYVGSRDELEKQQQQKAAEEVLEKLCPPTCVEKLWVQGYFGRHLPHWMMVPATSAFKSLRYLRMKDLPCCTQLPDGLGQLQSLESLVIRDVPAIKSVGPEFQASSSSVAVGGGVAPSTSAAFPSLTNLYLEGLCEWEEWEWEEQGEDVTADAMMAMPALKKLTINNCKLGRLPPELASSKRHALRRLNLYELSNLTCVENFPSVVELDVFDCPELKRIRIVSCRGLGSSVARI
ncbi:hypothetical protein EJB05_25659, partial [Eragrostis curvula]